MTASGWWDRRAACAKPQWLLADRPERLDVKFSRSGERVRTFDAWLVDLDGTLYRGLGVKCMMSLELLVLGARHARVLQRFRREHERLRRSDARGYPDPFRAQLQETAAATGYTVAAVERVVIEWMFDRPGKWLRLFRRRSLLHDIAQFRASGGQVAVVSDYPAERKLRAMRIHTCFDAVVANGESVMPLALKPDPAIVLEAARRLHVAPGRCLVIGDREDADGVAAAAAQMSFRRVG